MANFIIERDIYPVIGNTVDLNIKISKPKQAGSQSPVYAFDGGERVELYNVSNLIQNKATVKQNRKDVKYNSENQCHYFTVMGKLEFVSIDIRGDVVNDFNETELSIKIVKDASLLEEIKVKVQKQEQKIKIVAFHSDVNFIQKGEDDNKITLKYEIEGEGYTLSLLENAQKKEDCTIAKNTIEVPWGDQKRLGLYEYTLLATKNDQTLSKSIYIYYLEKSTTNPRSLPNNKTIINFCTSQEGDYLYALMYEKSSDKFEIGITNQIDGAASWSLTEVADSDTLRSFVTSPMVHLQSPDERTNDKYGHLFFIGGSQVGRIKKMMAAGNQVATIDLDNNNAVTLEKLKDADNIQTPFYKYGHTCVLFPTRANPNTLWMLGGQDTSGNTSNDVWTSTDGISWTNKGKAPWKARVMAGATVAYNGDNRAKEAIWLVGGFSEFAGGGGGFQNDIWQYQNDRWEQIDYLKINDKAQNYACSIAYGGIDTDDTHTGLFALESYSAGSSYIKKLWKNNNNKYEWDPNSPREEINFFNNGIFITAFFKECLWFLGINNKGADGISYGKLNYKIPTVHQKTINFYKNKLSEK